MANKNTGLNIAKVKKKDEFYTQLSDIERELKHYKQHFNGKTVLCNCDDPFESNFFKYFVLNFNRLGLKKLVATCYAESPIANKQLSIFDVLGEPENNNNKPYKAVVTTVYDKTGDGGIDMYDVAELFKSGENQLTELQGDGDFRSPECLALMDEADIVVTNPPFSLFRKYLITLIAHKKDFIIIGPQNSLHYKDIFPLIKDNKAWLGYGFQGNVGFFQSPYEDVATSSQHKEGMIRISGVMWITNLDIKKRHEEIILVKRYDPENYVKYLNYDAIDVPQVRDIPCDFAGKMGVPDTFLDKYNPDQFEIVGLAESSLGISIGFSENLTEEECRDLFHENRSFRRGNPIYRGKDGKLHKPFSRIIIRNLNPEKTKEEN